MISSSIAPFPHECYDLENKEEEEKQVYEPVNHASINADGNDLLEIIRAKESTRNNSYGYSCDRLNRPPSLNEIRKVINYKKWESEVNNKSKFIIGTLLSSFTKKLNEINCGSLEEKKEFLAIISGRIAAYYPFKIINDSMINFIDEKISKKVLCFAENKIYSLINNKDECQYDIQKIIIRKARETLLKDDNKLELINNISSKIREFHKNEYIKENLRLQHFDTKKIPFAIFIDLYNNHLTENYEYILSKFIDIFDGLGDDKECCMSFVFDTFLGEKVLHSCADRLRRVIFSSERKSQLLLEDLLSLRSTELSGSYMNSRENYHAYFKDFLDRSKEKLAEKINEHLTEKSFAIIIEDNIITVCKGSSKKKVLYYSKKYLEEKLKSYANCYNSR